MQLQDLVGEHVLDAVDVSNESLKDAYGDGYEMCQVMRFRLDGIEYTAAEDPNDGYRSSMRDLLVGGGSPMKNVFPGVRVVATHRARGEYHEDDILELRDAENGNLILEVGTILVGGCYPCFVASFKPELMAINAGKV